ncbi:MAG: hypothetical protein ACOYOU_01415, partial [Kiritimatiellia bacterium]
ARRAVILLPEGQRIAINVDEFAGVVTMQQTRGFHDLFCVVKPIGKWFLQNIRTKQADGTPFPPRERNAVILDILIERIAHSRTVRDVRFKAASGACDPFEEADDRLAVMAKAGLRTHL